MFPCVKNVVGYSAIRPSVISTNKSQDTILVSETKITYFVFQKWRAHDLKKKKHKIFSKYHYFCKLLIIISELCKVHTNLSVFFFWLVVLSTIRTIQAIQHFVCTFTLQDSGDRYFSFSLRFTGNNSFIAHWITSKHHNTHKTCWDQLTFFKKKIPVQVTFFKNFFTFQSSSSFIFF